MSWRAWTASEAVRQDGHGHGAAYPKTLGPFLEWCGDFGLHIRASSANLAVGALCAKPLFGT